MVAFTNICWSKVTVTVMLNSRPWMLNPHSSNFNTILAHLQILSKLFEFNRNLCYVKTLPGCQLSDEWTRNDSAEIKWNLLYHKQSCRIPWVKWKNMSSNSENLEVNVSVWEKERSKDRKADVEKGRKRDQKQLL